MNKKSNLTGKDYVWIILAIGAVYILATNILAAYITIILILIIIAVLAYFLIPELGVEGIIGLASLIRLNRRKK